jgi:hydrogenase/urease accessory protein HupE
MGIGAICSFVGGKLTITSAMPLAVIMMLCAILALFSGWLSRRDGGRVA